MADPMTDTAALVARLRAEAPRSETHGTLEAASLLTQAADRLESLSAPAADGEHVRLADAYLQALLDYSGAFYAVAIDRGIPAKDAANAMHHIERAARNLHAIAALPRREGMRIALELNAPRGIYTASKTYHAPLWQQYRAEGYPIISTWIDEAGPGETQDHHDLWTRCIHESQMCEAMVVYREGDDVLKGAWLEMGAALGAGVPVYAVGCREFTIGKSGLLIHCDTVDEAMSRARAALKGEA